MNILYPIGNGSTWNNQELRYSFRSLEFVKDLEGVIVAGHNPGFLSDAVTFIPTYHNFANPAYNIYLNLLEACKNDLLSESFAYVTDDCFFTKPISLLNYPYFHLAQIEDKLKSCSSGYYPHLFATQEALKKHELPTLNFDSHFPILIEKAKVLQLAEMYDWNRQHGYTFKSLYCNTFGIEGEFRPDCKVNSPHPLEWWVQFASERECFSIGDMALNEEGLIAFLKQVWPEKSIFEI